MAATDTPIPDDEELHEQALRHINEAWLAETENFEEGRDDQRFYVGEQWLPAAAQERTKANRPCIVVNRIPAFVRQVTGDVRRNTPAIKIAPARGDASEEVAEIFNGVIRHIEQESNAKAAYVQAIENACIAGMGVWKVTTEYSSDDAFEQDIRIRRISDPFAVVFDPACKEPDKSDARYVAEFIDLPKEEFQRLYPKAATAPVPSGPNTVMGLSWYAADSVRIAFYWYRKPVKRLLLMLADGRVLSGDDALAATREGESLEVVNKRTVEAFAVKMCIISGHEVLSGPHEWAGKYIPYCPVVGEEIWIEGRLVRKGMVRDAKDPQRVYNYMRTAAVEAAALQPKAPFIATVNQIKGLEKFWNTAGSSNHPVLPFNADPQNPTPPARSQPALAQDGLDSQAMIATDDIKAVTGIFDASLGSKSNETSGRAILARQREGDTATFHYIDNLAIGIRHCGRVLVDLIPKIYDTPRVVRVLKEDGGQEMVGVNVAQEGDEFGQAMRRLNDLSTGEYDVAVITGPSFATRRQEAAELMTQMIQAYPALMGIAGDLLVKNMDVPGAEEMAKRIERTIPPGVREDQPPEPPKPDPAVAAKALKDAASADLIKAQVEGQEVKNATDFLNLQAMMATLGAQMAGVQQAMAQMMAMQQAGGGGAPQIAGGQQPQPIQVAPAGGPFPMAVPAAETEPDLVELTPLEADMPEGVPV